MPLLGRRRATRDESSRVSRRVGTRQLLLDLRAELQALRRAPARAAKTLEQIATEWLPVKVRKIASAADFEARVNNHILPAFGERTWETLKKLDVEAFLLDLVQKKGLSAQTANHVRDGARQMVEDAIEHGDWLGSNPFAKADRFEIEDPDHDVLTKDEARRLLAALSKRWRPLFALAIYLGPRCKTIRNVRRTELDAERWFIDFNNTKTGKRIRRVPVPDELQPYLKQALAASRGGEWLFPNRWGTQRARNVKPLNAALRTAMRKAGLSRPGGGLPAITFRGLRRVSSCLHQEAGCSPWVVSKILGHSQASLAMMGSPTGGVTQRHYSFFSEGFVRQELNKLKLKLRSRK